MVQIDENQISGITELDEDGTGTVTANGAVIEGLSGVTEIAETNAVPGGAPSAGTGALWIRDDSPNVLVFTDDTGTDHVVNAPGGGEDLATTLGIGNSTGGTAIITDDVSGAAPANPLTLTSGANTGTSAGGNIDITTGTGVTVSGTVNVGSGNSTGAGNSGPLNLTTGSSAGGTSGDINVGTGGTTLLTGSLNFTTGEGIESFSGGNMNFTTNGSSGAGGNMDFTTGDNSNNTGGLFRVETGDGGIQGGFVAFTLGDGYSTQGGGFDVFAGDSNQGAGGAIRFYGGDALDVPERTLGQSGGSITLAAGNSMGPFFPGGRVIIEGGNCTSMDERGGDITLDPGEGIIDGYVEVHGIVKTPEGTVMDLNLQGSNQDFGADNATDVNIRGGYVHSGGTGDGGDVNIYGGVALGGGNHGSVNVVSNSGTIFVSGGETVGTIIQNSDPGEPLDIRTTTPVNGFGAPISIAASPGAGTGNVGGPISIFTGPSGGGAGGNGGTLSIQTGPGADSGGTMAIATGPGGASGDGNGGDIVFTLGQAGASGTAGRMYQVTTIDGDVIVEAMTYGEPR